MIIYFANRKMEILGQVSTGLPKGFFAFDDKKIEDIDTGVASFECTVSFERSEQHHLQEIVKAGNYMLRSNDDEGEFYTIIDAELDVDSQEIYVYAENAGLDLLNEIAQAFEAAEAKPIKWYIDKWTADSGFEIGINEIPGLTRKLRWEGESTVTERLASVATQFDNAEINYTFKIDGLRVLHKYINIYASRGKETNEILRINKNLDNIVVKSSVANLATALYVTGGTPEGKEDHITLSGYSYDDGDFYVDGKYLKSRKAVAKWSRYLSESGTGDGHIEKTYTYDTTSQKELCAHAVTELKRVCDAEVNYEIDIAKLPETVKIGDRVNLVDDNGEIYLSARVLKLETSVVQNSQKATLGEYLIKTGGISDKVQTLATQFAELAKNRTYYTWVVYADDENGSGISLESDGKAYIGISANRSSVDPDLSNPSAYKWSKLEGEAGRSLSAITEHYMVSDQSGGITIETSGWITGAPVPAMTSENKYLWNYETLIYSDGSTEDHDPKVIGVYGDSGERGESGEPAPSVVTMTKQYYLSTSKTEMIGGDWVRVLPEWTADRYLWSRWCTEWSEPNPTLLTYSGGTLETTWNEIHELAADSNTLANEAQTKATAVETSVTKINTELKAAQTEVAALQGNLETVSNEMTANYAKKQELTDVNTSLGTRIEENAKQITSTATSLSEIKINASEALSNAEEAQKAAKKAEENFIAAQEDYNTLKNRADTTDEEIEEAGKKLTRMQENIIKAQDEADKAVSLANGLSNRMTAAESNITQNSEGILATVTKIDTMRIGSRNYALDTLPEKIAAQAAANNVEVTITKQALPEGDASETNESSVADETAGTDTDEQVSSIIVSKTAEMGLTTKFQNGDLVDITGTYSDGTVKTWSSAVIGTVNSATVHTAASRDEETTDTVNDVEIIEFIQDVFADIFLEGEIEKTLTLSTLSITKSIARWELSSDWIPAETYTVSFEGTKTDGNFEVYRDHGYVLIASESEQAEGTETAALKYDTATGRYYSTFTCPAAYAGTPAQALNTLTIHNSGGATADWEIKLLKLEKGNKQTDWTPAPEDASNSLEDSIDKVNTETSSINQTLDKLGIPDGVSTVNDKGEVVSDGDNLFDALTKVIKKSTEIDTNADKVEMRFQTVEEAQKVTNSQLADEIATRKNYITFSDSGITLGQTEGESAKYRVVITNTGINFVYIDEEAETVPAYINSNKLHIKEAEIENGEIENDLWLGGFRWFKRANGNLALKYDPNKDSSEDTNN